MARAAVPQMLPLLLLAGCSVVQGSLSKFLESITDPMKVDYPALCKSMDKTYQGHGMRWGGGKTTLHVTCSGQKVTVVCEGSTCKSSEGGEKVEKEEESKTPDKPATEEATKGADDDGDGSTSSGAGGHWQCPAKWHTGAAPSDAEAKTWTMSMNLYRCVHDVPSVQWSEPVANDIKTYLAPLKEMKHSKSYDVKPPAGPAGENLFWGSGSWTPGDAAKSWYSEVKDCTQFPGCTGSGFSHNTGHFTAMIWKGVKTIGCTSNAHGLKGCRYKGTDTLDCATPNMQGCYTKNVPKAKKSFGTCKKLVQKCFGEKLPSGVSLAERVGGEGEQAALQPSLGGASAWIMAAAAAVAVAAALVAAVAGLGAVRTVMRRQSVRTCAPDDPLVALVAAAAAAENGIE